MALFVLFNMRQLHQLLHDLIIEDFYPVTIRILNESNALHLAVIWFLDKLDSLLLKALAGLLHIWHHDANVTVASGVGVSIVVWCEVRI